MFMHVTSHNAHSPARGGWYIFYEAETMHAHSYTHVIHAWCFNDLLFLPSAGRRHQPSAVISGSSGPEPGPNTCIAHAPIAHSCMHACIPACIPPGSCVQYPRKRADPQSASEEKVGVCMHEPFLFFFMHTWYWHFPVCLSGRFKGWRNRKTCSSLNPHNPPGRQGLQSQSTHPAHRQSKQNALLQHHQSRQFSQSPGGRRPRHQLWNLLWVQKHQRRNRPQWT